MNAHPDQMVRIIKHSDKVSEVSNEIKSKVYCVLDGKTAFRNVRMIFVTDNFNESLMVPGLFREVESFLNNGNTWKQEASFCKGLLYMLQDIRGAEPYLPITPPKPSASRYGSDLSPATIDDRLKLSFRPLGSYRWKPSVPLTLDSRQPTSTPLSSSTIGPMLGIQRHISHSQVSSSSASTITRRLPHYRMCGKGMKGHGKIVCICQWCGRPKPLHNGQVCQPQKQPSISAQSTSKGKDQGTFRMAEGQSTQSSSKGKGRERSRTPDPDSRADLELEEHVSRLEERLDYLGL
ncbi:hypothetical protein EDD18DRAFT_1105475 [Armillaria luteobubalina]|uniref:Uncharacterized protein n=1 Tax=Armillaria luteobubalina TaxID=153913 RepID=A0AA39Q661_9AGAR|nr:hypothetical protein EDD18DRAFT_1105475 [Armillaria luteobubalina]